MKLKLISKTVYFNLFLHPYAQCSGNPPLLYTTYSYPTKRKAKKAINEKGLEKRFVTTICITFTTNGNNTSGSERMERSGKNLPKSPNGYDLFRNLLDDGKVLRRSAVHDLHIHL
jgi:hypothetical protein